MAFLPSTRNAAQIDYWNARAGETWARFQEQLDRQIHTLGLRGIQALALRGGERVLDIGCGCGQSTFDLAAAVGPQGFVLGADISQPMLNVAIERTSHAQAAQVQFKRVDAQTEHFASHGGAFDAVYSRFGVMFFDDPIAAFANMRSALRASGRIAFVCWRPLRENDWMRLPMEAALPLLPPPTPSDPMAPGPFAFADPERVRSLLTAAGFTRIAALPFDAQVGSGDVSQTLELTLKVGPLGSALREHPELRDPVASVVRRVLEQHLTAQGVLMSAAVWIFSAHAGEQAVI